MKVLYIGHYRDGTGWGNAAVNNILSMDAAGIDVVPRAITYEAKDSPYPDRIKELESKSSDDCDVVIQHTLPQNYSYNSKYKNIGIMTCETSNFKSTGWQHNCNLMDEIWVSSSVAGNQVLNSGVNKPVRVIPYGLDLTKYDSFNTTGQKIQELENQFTFGFVGEFIERKNVKALIQAFHIAFEPEEPVNLFIKTSKKDLEFVQKYIAQVKNGLKIRKNYKEEVVISGMMPEKDYLSVLAQVDCFVMPSRGEACCIPSLEAMAMGIPTIYTQGIGMDHLFDLAHGVTSYPSPCFGAVETLDSLDTADSDWREIDVRELAVFMRNAVQSLSNPTEKEKTKTTFIEHSKMYSHESIGNLIKEALNDC
jgi:glycosyltransferase involved in cell wall biosynthesis